MRLKSEDEILNIDIRRAIIKEIQSEENQQRKDEAFKRFECLKDQTAPYITAELEKQFSAKTVEEMSYAMSNISFVRKVSEKLARVYSNGVTRTIEGSDEATKSLQSVAKVLGVDTTQKKTNRFLKVQRNLLAWVRPYPVDDKWSLKVEPMQPYLYDVVENFYNREKPLVIILSDYKKEQSGVTNKGDNKDQKIADTPSDEKIEHIVWWSRKYHFTTDQHGQIISQGEDDQGVNPIGELPFINYALDQDGSFWAIGGNDLIDGHIMLNCMMTHINHIAVSQGYGQLVMSGSGLPKEVITGPTKAILLEKEDPQAPNADVKFINANPQLAELLKIFEAYVALLLTTNNLSTTGISANLQSGASVASGIALVIDKAESMEDVQDQAQIFHDNEPHMWRIIAKWLSVYGSKQLLVDELKDFKLPEKFSLNLKFGAQTPIMTEKEKLENIKLREELGINTMIELIKIDDPSLTDEQADAKLKKILEEKAKRLMTEMDITSSTEKSDDTQDPMSAVEEVDPQTQRQGSNTEVKVETDFALNGAQITAVVDLVEKVAMGTLPREAAVNIISAGFNIDMALADKMLGSVGKGFKPQQPVEPAPRQTEKAQA